MSIETNNHSVFKLNYCLIIPIKFRREVLVESIGNRAKEIFEYISPKHGVVIEEWTNKPDHVVIRFKAQPNTEFSKFINAFKSASSRLIRKEFPEIKEQLAEAGFWSKSYLLMTIGDVTDDVIRDYLDLQHLKVR